jgi:hypothetical protein
MQSQIETFVTKIDIKYLNNAEIEIHEADFETQDALHQAIFEALKSCSSVGEIVATIASDKKVNDLLWKCLARCTYNKVKITKDIFDNKEYRVNYYPIKIACLRENILPFLPALILMLSNIQSEKEQSNQELK